jgi:hypothetical protein
MSGLIEGTFLTQMKVDTPQTSVATSPSVKNEPSVKPDPSGKPDPIYIDYNA